jgi:hypothetical protein
MRSLLFACRYCSRIKYDITCGRELTSASEQCSVPLTAAGEDTVPDIKTYGRHSTDKQKESVLVVYKHSNSHDYDDYYKADKKSNSSIPRKQFHSL